MRHARMRSLQDWLRAVPGRGPRFWAAGADVGFDALARGSSLGEGWPQLQGRSVLLLMEDQLATALALVALDGLVRRLLLCPPGLPASHRAEIIAGAEIDAVVSDRDVGDLGPTVSLRVAAGRTIHPAAADVVRERPTEWVMLTSGTSGAPKMVVHSLASLTGAIREQGAQAPAMVWGTFYDVRRFGGLQIFLRSILCSASLVLSGAGESIGRYLARAGSLGVTHISGTPSQWRSALAYPTASAIAPRNVRLSGEIADQAILDALRARYPQAEVVHAYASTEAGVGFEVDDGRAGFPIRLVDADGGEVALRVREGALHIRSARAASRYLGPDVPALADADGFIDTGDLVERRGDRYVFVGRRGGIINVGGLKVHPEEVEAVINRHPQVQASLVHSRRNMITGAIVVADVVLRAPDGDVGDRAAEVKREILESCRQTLANYKVPAAIRFVAALDVAASGKSLRQSA